MTLLPTWRYLVELGFSGGGVSCPASRQEAGEAQLNKKYFIAFNSSPSHPPFASTVTMPWPSILDQPEAFSTVV